MSKGKEGKKPKRNLEKLTQPPKPAMSEKNAAPFINPKKEIEPHVKSKSKPVLGMTWMRIEGAYSLRDLGKMDRKNPDGGYYEELRNLQEGIQKYDTLDQFMDAFHTRHGEINPDSNEILKEELKRIRRLRPIEKENIIHIHCKSRGKGKFTLFGFEYENVFEILLLDPEHEIAGK